MEAGWQSYVESNMVMTGFVTVGAILGHDGSIWAISPGFNVSADETKKLFAGYSDPSPLRAGGLFINGQRYLVLKADDRSIYGKKGTGGVITVKTGQAILVGLYDEKIQPGQCANVMEKLADYLIENSY
jgi:profilin